MIISQPSATFNCRLSDMTHALISSSDWSYSPLVCWPLSFLTPTPYTHPYHSFSLSTCPTRSGCKPSPPPPRPVLPPNETSYVFDFGQNVAGFTSLHVSAALGSKIFIRHGEDLSFVPEPGDPSPVLNKFCSNNDIQPGSAGDKSVFKSVCMACFCLMRVHA